MEAKNPSNSSADDISLLQAASLKPGTLVFDRYEILAHLGTGGIGSMYKVVDHALEDSILALKALHPHLFDDATLRTRLQNEVLLVRQLSHKNIVHVYDFFATAAGRCFITMEYVRGRNLDERLHDPSLPALTFFEKSRILYLIAEAMAYAHQRGIVHRNLKPLNILITNDEQVKLSDFAFAKAFFNHQSLTKTGEIIGTPHYSPPEQVLGKHADKRSDIYSFGIVAYELVTGSVPFSGESFFEIADKHLREPIPKFVEKYPEAPAWFQDFVEKCTAKDPNKRYQTFKEVIIGLQPGFGAKSQVPQLTASAQLKNAHRRGVRESRTQRFGKAVFVYVLTPLFVLAMILFILRNQHEYHLLVAKPIYKLERLFNSELPLLKRALMSEKVIPFTPLGFFDEKLQGNKDYIEILLAVGFDADIKDQNGYTPAAMAAIEHHGDVLALLLSQGADDTLLFEPEKRTLLMLAVRADNTAGVAVLLEHYQHKNSLGAELEKQDSAKRTALHLAAESGNLSVASLLIDSGASLQSRDYVGDTPLILAALSGKTELVHLFLQKNADTVDFQNKAGRTALMCAAEQGETEITNMLIAANADGTIADSAGNTALHFAVSGKHYDVAKILVEDSPKLAHIKNDAGVTPLELAKVANDREMVKLLTGT